MSTEITIKEKVQYTKWANLSVALYLIEETSMRKFTNALGLNSLYLAERIAVHHLIGS